MILSIFKIYLAFILQRNFFTIEVVIKNLQMHGHLYILLPFFSIMVYAYKIANFQRKTHKYPPDEASPPPDPQAIANEMEPQHIPRQWNTAGEILQRV